MSALPVCRTHIKDLGDAKCYFHMLVEITSGSVNYPRDGDVILLAFELEGF